MTVLTEKAKAKLNLYLYVTGKRADGYHQLDSLVTFCNAYDLVTLKEAEEFRFSCEGHFSEFIDAEKNICVNAAEFAADYFDIPLNCHIHLQKNLPVASGLGGGSADAAAVIRLLLRYWNKKMSDDLVAKSVALGADVPMCLVQKSAVVQGVGEKMKKIQLPKIYFVLVNPLQPCSTKEVFEGFSGAFHGKEVFLSTATYTEFIESLKTTDNHLELSAVQIVPEILQIKKLILECEGCDYAAMSGSGATCFGIFSNKEKAVSAALNLQQLCPDYWVKQGSGLFA